jgi:hypothetical protein
LSRQRTYSPDLVRHDKIDKDGKLTLHVNGQLSTSACAEPSPNPRDHVIHDLHVRIVHATSGGLLRELIIDPTHNNQPSGKPRCPHRKTALTCPDARVEHGASP